MAATPAELAYDLSVRAISDQARVLEELRSRAGTLFAAAALATSFLGGQALTRDPHGIAVLSLSGFAIGCFIASALLGLLVLWPFRFAFSLSAREMLRELERRGTSLSGAYEELAIRIELNYDLNTERIRWLFWLLRGAIVFLILEVAAWIIALWRM